MSTSLLVKLIRSDANVVDVQPDAHAISWTSNIPQRGDEEDHDDYMNRLTQDQRERFFYHGLSKNTYQSILDLGLRCEIIDNDCCGCENEHMLTFDVAD